MSQSHFNANQAAAPIKIQRSDWQRLPAWFKRQIDGVPSVLSVGGFVPVQIL
ncbi:hypothetical protein [Deefgea sp. CFH1-16]|uniref:hypothetical protein n=1 Tax=Deefgea sp. CFH1-16 TaxID=2675457 RepID=UPI0015F42218|nr:hypothetical protein [Deefgea sp. CFH1-16]MBM5575797.1 hypothetical protein [Deefgea sp. CFH1-16]